MKKTMVFAAVLAAAAPMASQAQFAKPEDAVKYRKAALTVLGTHFGRIGAVVRGDRPFNAQEVQANAAIAETMIGLPWPGFMAGTDKGETRAKPEIWTDAAKFKSAQDGAIKAIADLSAAAKSGNLDQVKAAFGEAGKACKTCHDAFRKD
jgi:cytochrome c556